MRALVAFAGGLGHLRPMLPLVHALRAAGHDLALSGAPGAAAGPWPAGLFDAVLPHVRVDPGPAPDGGTGTLVAPDLEHEITVVGRWYAGTLAQRNLTRTGAVIASWRPDVVICDEMDFGSVAAAARAGLPCVVVDVIASGALARRPYVDAGLAALGLDPAAARGDLEVCPFPPSLRDPAFALSAGAAVCRPGTTSPADGGRHPAVGWLADHDGPRAYLSLGTIFNRESGDLFPRLLAGLAIAGVRVLATVGADVDPDRVGVAGADLRLERFVPQEQVLPHVDLVVNHGGSGSVVGALAHGLPVVTAAMGADQALNAARLEVLGAGVALDVVSARPAQVAAAVGRCLGDPGLRVGARGVAAEIAELPAVAAVVPAILGLGCRG